MSTQPQWEYACLKWQSIFNEQDNVWTFPMTLTKPDGSVEKYLNTTSDPTTSVIILLTQLGAEGWDLVSPINGQASVYNFVKGSNATYTAITQDLNFWLKRSIVK